MNKKISYMCMYLLSSLGIPTTLVCAVPHELVYLAYPNETQLLDEWPVVGQVACYKAPEENYFYHPSHIHQLQLEARGEQVVIKISTKNLKEKFVERNLEGEKVYYYQDRVIPSTALITSYAQQKKIDVFLLIFTAKE